MLRKLPSFLTRGKRRSSTLPQATIIPREQHGISSRNISPAAQEVLQGLHKAGFQAFLVGGCLRDLLIGKTPKDFDVATNASPEEVQALFRRSRIIGRRFRIVHVRFGRDVVEVSTFRALADEDTDSRHHTKSHTGLILRDNIFGSIEEDALRRDFTVNALYYNIADGSLHDFANSLTDIKRQRLRLIGDPATRYREDPVRMLRAARFAAKLGFTLDTASEAPIRKLAGLLRQVPAARLFDEQSKLFLSGHAVASFQELVRLGLFAILFPETAALTDTGPEDPGYRLILAAMRNTDDRLAAGKSVTPAFLLAVILWPAVSQADGDLQQAMSKTLSQQVRIIAIPKRFSCIMRDIWSLQTRLEKQRRPADTLQHPRFRAAYDFLLLREEAGLLPNNRLGKWWSDFQNANSDQQGTLIENRPEQHNPSNRSSRGGSTRSRARRSRNRSNTPQ
jgi:poly(A) polymerase